jgi:cysteine synthase A
VIAISAKDSTNPRTEQNDFIAETMDLSLVDQVIKISDQEAFAESRELAEKEGIFAGSSSGAALAAAKKLISQGTVQENSHLVILLPDRGDRYFSKGLYQSTH